MYTIRRNPIQTNHALLVKGNMKATGLNVINLNFRENEEDTSPFGIGKAWILAIQDFYGERESFATKTDVQNVQNSLQNSIDNLSSTFVTNSNFGSKIEDYASNYYRTFSIYSSEQAEHDAVQRINNRLNALEAKVGK